MYGIVDGLLLTFVIQLIIMVFAIWALESARKGKLKTTVQRIPAIEAIDEAVERCVERGRPLMYDSGGAISGRAAPTQFATLDVLGRLTDRMASLGTPMLVAVYYAESISVTQDVVRMGYTSGGHPEAFNIENIKWWGDEWTSYYSGVLTWLYDKKPAAYIMLTGLNWGGAMLAHDCHKIDCILLGADTSATGLSLSYLGPDVLIMMEELYATAAYLTKDPLETSALFAGDYLKILWVGLIVIGVIAAVAGFPLLDELLKM